LVEGLRAARAEAGELVATLRSKASAAAAEVTELRHQCRQTGEKLVLEIGEQSLALTRVRQAREQAEELARGTDAARADVRALREECDRVTSALTDLTEQSRTAFQDALDEALAGVRRLREEIDSVRVPAAEPYPPQVANRTTGGSGAEATAAEPHPAERKNRFGVTVAPRVIITEVLADSPAETAGLALGDAIEEANGRPVRTGLDLRDALDPVPDGEGVTFQLVRGGERFIRTVPLGHGTAEGKSRFGVTVAQRVVVEDVFADSPAKAAGLARGDAIEDAHGQPVQNAEQFLSIIHSQPEGAAVALVVTRDGERYELLARLDGA
jgi:C-terminal processing protease CtpA/Prc